MEIIFYVNWDPSCMADWQSLVDDKKKNNEGDDFDACLVGNTNDDEDWSETGQVSNIELKCMYINKY